MWEFSQSDYFIGWTFVIINNTSSVSYFFSTEYNIQGLKVILFLINSQNPWETVMEG